MRPVCVGGVTHSYSGSDDRCLCRMTIFVGMKWNAGGGVDCYSRARPRSLWGSVHSLFAPPPSVRSKGGSLISLLRRFILVAVDAVPLIAGGGVDQSLSRPPSFISGKLSFYLLPPAFVRKDSPSSFLR